MSNKIDAMVVERVMGWVRRTNAQAIGIIKVTDDDREMYHQIDELDNHWWSTGSEPRQMGCVEDEGLSREDFENAWSPSTDISAAWAVVEEWGVLPWSIDNGWRQRDGEPLSGVTCKVTTHTDSFEATEKDAPLAICVCALRAKGVPESAIQEALQ